MCESWQQRADGTVSYRSTSSTELRYAIIENDNTWLNGSHGDRRTFKEFCCLLRGIAIVRHSTAVRLHQILKPVYRCEMTIPKDLQSFSTLDFKSVLRIPALTHLVKLLPVALGALALAPAALADDMPRDWKTYGNARFHYQICYPSALLKPQGEPDNGDGQSFLGENGAELDVFGRNRVDGLTLADNAKMEATQLAGGTGKTTYQAVRKGWAVVSGNNGKDSLFYSKILENDDHYVVFELKYPQKESAVYNKVATALAKCLKSDKSM